jgi:hypothetical protein
MNRAYPTQPKQHILSDEKYKKFLKMTIVDFGNILDSMRGDMMTELSRSFFPGTIINLQEEEARNRRNAGKLNGASIENADKLAIERELLQLKRDAVEKRGNACGWSIDNCTATWRERFPDDFRWWKELVSRYEVLRIAQAKAATDAKAAAEAKAAADAKAADEAKAADDAKAADSSAAQPSKVNNHKNCEIWASLGECETNPAYMMSMCGKACDELKSSGGKRRSKSSNKPKKSAKRAKTAKRSKSRKIRRQRK